MGRPSNVNTKDYTSTDGDILRALGRSAKPMKFIASQNNPIFKKLVKLAESSHERKKQQVTLIDGAHLIEVYWQRFGLPQIIVVSETGQQVAEIANLLQQFETVDPVILKDSLFKNISTLTTPSGILAVVSTPKPEKNPDNLAFGVACEGIQDPGNLGSILRSAAAAGVKHIFLSKDCVSAWAPKVIRAGQGAHFLISIHEDIDLQTLTKNFQGNVIATTLNAPQSLFDADLTGPLMLLIGNEGQGLSPALIALASHQVRIPMPGGMESLNAAAAAAICLFEYVRQRDVSLTKLAK